MTTPRRLLLIPIACLAFAACGDDDHTESADTVSATSTPTTALVVTTPAPDATVAVPTTGEPPTVPEPAPDGPLQIDVVVGHDSGENRVEKVKAGSSVTLNITNPDADDEFHIHGIELEQAVGQGVMATFNFVATTPGTYAVESHITEDVLVVLVVE